jgi:hypothetical protein
MDLLFRDVNGRQDINDVALDALVRSNNYKQALANCERRLKKKNKEPHLDVLLVSQPLKSSFYR